MNFSRYTPGTRPAVDWVTPNHSAYYSRETPIFSYIFRVLTRHISKCVQILGVSRQFYVLHNFGCLFLFNLYNLLLSVLSRVSRPCGPSATFPALPCIPARAFLPAARGGPFPGLLRAFRCMACGPFLFCGSVHSASFRCTRPEWGLHAFSLSRTCFYIP